MRTKRVNASLAFLVVVAFAGVAAGGCSAGSGNPSSSTGGAAGTGTTGGAGRGGTTGTAGGGGGIAGTSAGGGGQSGTVGSGGAGGSTGSAGSGGSAGAGVAGAAGGGPGAGGRGGGSGAGAGGTTAGSGGSSGRGGASGGAGGGSARWTCPSGQLTAPTPSSITLTKVAGVPPFDTFNNNGNNFGNIEGACWFGDALYVSEIASGTNPPPSRILRVPTTGAVSIAFPNSGTNGLAIDTTGRLIGASHGAGGLLAFNLTNMTSTPIVSAFMGTRFNSPNDLTVRSDGTIYFTDPDYQAASPRPQMMNRVYRVPPGSATPVVVDAGRSQPNGITLSLDETILYVADNQGLWRYQVNGDSSTGAATQVAQNLVPNGDGMAIDCLGNLYVASQQRVIVYNPSGNGMMLGSIAVNGVQSVTNVAFGGANHQTLYVTGQGTGMGGGAMGLYRSDLPLPGMPY